MRHQQAYAVDRTTFCGFDQARPKIRYAAEPLQSKNYAVKIKLTQDRPFHRDEPSWLTTCSIFKSGEKKWNHPDERRGPRKQNSGYQK